ncbi:hypothetical protein B0H19DRAFT_296826 [Mycena capillaripes]|nr:hypothetical protein B0H19DRAFT_296826 [Mycena capillaripes]
MLGYRSLTCLIKYTYCSLASLFTQRHSRYNLGTSTSTAFGYSLGSESIWVDHSVCRTHERPSSSEPPVLCPSARFKLAMGSGAPEGAALCPVLSSGELKHLGSGGLVHFVVEMTSLSSGGIFHPIVDLLASGSGGFQCCVSGIIKFELWGHNIFRGIRLLILSHEASLVQGTHIRARAVKESHAQWDRGAKSSLGPAGVGSGGVNSSSSIERKPLWLCGNI